MFELIFKYPLPVFTKGRYLLLAAWPVWVLLVGMLGTAAVLGWLTWHRLPTAAAPVRNWRAWLLCGLQVALIWLVLALLWEPAISVAELKSQQNIIAVLLDDSRSMGIADAGRDGREAREQAAIAALTGPAGVLAGLGKRFQVRLYRMDSRITQLVGKPGSEAAAALQGVRPEAAATHIDSSLRQLLAETQELPVGAVVLVSDGAENAGGGGEAGGIGVETMAALHNRRLPVHVVGFGREDASHDLELDDAALATTAMAESRMTATVSFHQHGYSGQSTTLAVRDGDTLLAQQQVTLAAQGGTTQSETIFFNAGAAGVKTIGVSLGTLPNEENTRNNAVTRLLDVSGEKRRILYVEGEPRWEYKFLRRAAEDDKSVQVVSMLRTTENKIYRQGIADPSELADGFPSKAEDLFRYQAVVIGSVEAGYLTPVQQELLREFVDKRGGGVLFLGGRYALGQGGWAASGDADLLPTFLPDEKTSFHRDAATVELTAAGAESPLTRLIDDRAQNIERWKKLPYLADYQDVGTPKPGATVLATLNSGKTLPLLVTESYGRGRTAVLATSGTWRWQMSGAVGDTAHDLFWQQLLRWLAADAPGQVEATMPSQTLMDEGRVRLTATVRDKEYTPAPDAKVTAHLIGPEGTSALVEMEPVENTPGTFAMDWTAEKPGSYVAEVSAQRGAEELGRQVLAFRREDGVAENFHTGQNRELLGKLASETGGRYWQTADLPRLPKEISYSEAGISVRDTKELWNMPAVFLALFGLFTSEWLLRRSWGIV